MSAAFNRMATVRVSIKRPPAMSGTPPTRGVPVLVAAGVPCTPFSTLRADVAARVNFARPFELKQTSLLTEVREGDTLTRADNGLDYPVISVDQEPNGPGAGITYMAIIHEVK